MAIKKILICLSLFLQCGMYGFSRIITTLRVALFTN
jgi:hypothetical protein